MLLKRSAGELEQQVKVLCFQLKQVAGTRGQRGVGGPVVRN